MKLMDLLNTDFTKFTKDDILKNFGLEERRGSVDYILPALGLFGAGIVVGAGLGMLFAPKTGHELRDTIKSKVGRVGAGIGGGEGGYGGGYEGSGRGYESGLGYEGGKAYEGTGSKESTTGSTGGGSRSSYGPITS